MVFGPLDKVYRITVAETVTLSPNMVGDIPCVIEGVSGHKECVGVVEPGKVFCIQKGILLEPCGLQ